MFTLGWNYGHPNTIIICPQKGDIPGSTVLAAPEEHIFWFGHPAHAETFPALSLWVPGQSEIIDKK